MMAAMDTVQPESRNFEDIYTAHYRRVLNLCRYLLNSAEGAEDAAHEVFLRAHAKLSSYNPELPLSSWILKIASNYCIDILRRRSAEKRIFNPDPGEGFEPAASGASPLAEVLSAERGKDVRRALSQLPDKYRVPLVLAFYNEHNYEEIAAAIGVERSQVAILIFRGKQHLRQRLGKEQPA